MATYILLLTLTPEGRTRALEEPDYMLGIESTITVPDVQTLGLYAVLGPYDFVTIVSAPSNEAAARFSIELGVKAGVHVLTLPVIPASSLDEDEVERSAGATAEVRPPVASPELERVRDTPIQRS